MHLEVFPQATGLDELSLACLSVCLFWQVGLSFVDGMNFHYDSGLERSDVGLEFSKPSLSRLFKRLTSLLSHRPEVVKKG